MTRGKPWPLPVTAAVFITGMIGLGALLGKSNEEGYRSHLSRDYPPRPQGTYEVAGERVLIKDFDLDRNAGTLEYLDRSHPGYVVQGFEKHLPGGIQMSHSLRHAASEVLREVDPSTEQERRN